MIPLIVMLAILVGLLAAAVVALSMAIEDTQAEVRWLRAAHFRLLRELDEGQFSADVEHHHYYHEPDELADDWWKQGQEAPWQPEQEAEE